MRISLVMRACRVYAAATLCVLLGAPPVLSHAMSSGVGLRVGMVQGHARRARSHGWTGNAWGRQGQNGWNCSSRWNGWGRNAWRWNGWGCNGWYWSQAGLYGFGYWPSPDAYASAATPPADDGPPIVIGAPSIPAAPHRHRSGRPGPVERRPFSTVTAKLAIELSSSVPSATVVALV